MGGIETGAGGLGDMNKQFGFDAMAGFNTPAAAPMDFGAPSTAIVATPE